MNPISVAYFDQVALFSDFSHLVELYTSQLHPRPPNPADSGDFTEQ